jgi:hypothetical protein
MKIDIGSYRASPDDYQKIVDRLYKEYSSVALPPGYNFFLQEYTCLKSAVRTLIKTHF